MIVLTRLNGAGFVLNAGLIERVETTPDTVVTLINGDKHLVKEDIETVVSRVRAWHAEIFATITTAESGTPTAAALRLVPDSEVT